MGIGIIEGVKSFFSPSQPEQTGAAVIEAMRATQHSRPEYQALLVAVRSGKLADELATLAVIANVSQNEVLELRRLRNSAVKRADDAKAYPALEAEHERIESELKDVAKKLAVAVTDAERALLRQQAAKLLRDRGEVWPKCCHAAVCHRCVEAAKAAGLI